LPAARLTPKQAFAMCQERRREAEHGVVGDPFVASTEKGSKLFAVLVERLVALCREYHAEEPPKYRGFESHSA